jgi:NAD(P)-dependent dehydrogenase (short-subunit alcohol dehydrogenase family)
MSELVAVVTGAAKAMRLATSASTLTSQRRALASPPAARMALTASSNPASSTSASTTRAPSWANSSAVARPMPCAADTYGGLDTVFNNAGIEQPVTPSTEVTEALFDRVISVNLKGTFFGCKHALPLLKARGGGTVVNNASVSAFANVGGNVSYAASKGAVMSLTRVLAVEVARENIRVNAICPGVIDTGMNRRNLELSNDPEAVAARWLQATPMGRMGTPEEVAQTVLYLASSQSSFTTGVGLLIDGGRVAT